MTLLVLRGRSASLQIIVSGNQKYFWWFYSADAWTETPLLVVRQAFNKHGVSNWMEEAARFRSRDCFLAAVSGWGEGGVTYNSWGSRSTAPPAGNMTQTFHHLPFLIDWLILVNLFFFRSHFTLVYPSLIFTPLGRQIQLALCAKDSPQRLGGKLQDFPHLLFSPSPVHLNQWPHQTLRGRQAIQSWAICCRTLDIRPRAGERPRIRRPATLKLNFDATLKDFNCARTSTIKTWN